jgi:hypothetical protein
MASQPIKSLLALEAARQLGQSTLTQNEMAAKIGVHRCMIIGAKRILAHGPPNLLAMVEAGQITVMVASDLLGVLTAEQLAGMSAEDIIQHGRTMIHKRHSKRAELSPARQRQAARAARHRLPGDPAQIDLRPPQIAAEEVPADLSSVARTTEKVPGKKTMGQMMREREAKIPHFNRHTAEELGMPPPELADRQHPDYPEGWTYAHVFREQHGRVQLFTTIERQRMANYERLTELARQFDELDLEFLSDTDPRFKYQRERGKALLRRIGRKCESN